MNPRIALIAAVSALAVLAAGLAHAAPAGADPIVSYADMIIDDEPLAYWRLGESCLSFPCTMVDEMGNTNGSFGATALTGEPALVNLAGDDTAASAVVPVPPATGDWNSVPVSGTGAGTLRPSEFTFETWFQHPTGDQAEIAIMRNFDDPFEDLGGWHVVFLHDNINALQICVSTDEDPPELDVCHIHDIPDDDLPHYFSLTIDDSRMITTVDSEVRSSELSGPVSIPPMPTWCLVPRPG